MEQNVVGYFPYQAEAVLLRITGLLLGSLCLIAFGFSVTAQAVALSLILGCICCASLWLVFYSRKAACAQISVGSDGVWFSEHGTPARFLSWDALPYGYCAANEKNTHCWILSPRELSKKEAKQIIRSIDLSFGRCMLYASGCLLIYKNITQDAALLEQGLCQHVSFQKYDWYDLYLS